MVVMVQDEVGRAMAAKPGDMSLLSVSVQAFATPAIVRRVSAHSFHPRPKVDSLVLRLDALPTPLIDPDGAEAFLDFVGAGFHSPRKQLHNSFGHGLTMPRERIEELLSRGLVDTTRRPETLAVEEWVRLWRIYRTMTAEEEPPC
jgi:16S rRNA (adenine1518-N6/adenine1519-N6)-dimethyltransferase